MTSGGGSRTEDDAPLVGLVLAAGAGSRLRPLTDDLPKTLLAVDGDRSILDLAAANLAKVGVAELVLLTGFAHERIDAHVPVLEQRHGLPVRTIFNDRALEWNNAYSLFLAAEVFSTSPTIVVNGDTVHPVAVEEALLAARHPQEPDHGIVLALDTVKPLADEEMKVTLDDAGCLQRITKRMDPADADGEYIGVTLVEPHAGGALAAALRTTFERDTGLYYEDGYQQYVEDGHTVRVAPIGEQAWVEVDDHADLARARELR